MAEMQKTPFRIEGSLNIWLEFSTAFASLFTQVHLSSGVELVEFIIF
ncbi:hypothetical protein C8D94_102362 [Marinirhabdus gelatinilytica]|uniref:Uncharacterized protein n=1 Tax=Marinirhabdus gelatinilytica TaxID=1703343 RepID=A0A370QFV3_9FLAO|nr:hypothetical protein C8D94_102362 [Marinirhabdus gelatinilytica]